MKHFMTISFLLAALSAHAQKTTTDATTTEPGATPAQTCAKLVEATKADNFETVSKMTVMPEHMKQAPDKKTVKNRFEKMHKSYLDAIRDMTCGTEIVAGDRAIVTAESKDEKRLIPFIQDQGQWKFDMKTYRAFYLGDRKEMKRKSM